MESLRRVAGSIFPENGDRCDGASLRRHRHPRQQCAFVSSSLVSQIPFVRDGRLRAIATTGAKRAPLTPNVPTVIESGIPGFDVTAWHGILAPARTPPETIRQLNREIVRTLGLPDVREALLAEGGEITSTSPQEFAELSRGELQMWTS